MALYAFNGTWNKDEPDPTMDTNVIKFVEIYNRSADPDDHSEIIDGVGTRYSTFGKMAGGITGAGGQKRIQEMYVQACENYENGDKEIDVIGFSRGAALAVHFCNVINEAGLKMKNGDIKKPRIRFLGVWDIVGSFGIPINFIINFQEINLGYDFGLPENVDHVFHAMARDELRQTFRVTRLDPQHAHDHVEEIWFRGVHSDVGGGNGNIGLSYIALKWMLERAIESGLTINQNLIKDLEAEIDPTVSLGENKDLIKNKSRKIYPGDEFHETALGKTLKVGESAEFRVDAPDLYSWSGVRLVAGGQYVFSIPGGQIWCDATIKCGPDGWTPEGEDMGFFKSGIMKLAEIFKRHSEANWFEVIGAVEENDDHLFRIGDGSKAQKPFVSPIDGGLYAFANDAKSKYDNNKGTMKVTVKRVG